MKIFYNEDINDIDFEYNGNIYHWGNSIPLDDGRYDNGEILVIVCRGYIEDFAFDFLHFNSLEIEFNDLPVVHIGK